MLCRATVLFNVLALAIQSSFAADVFPQTFGAVADGIHNDTDAVRAAVKFCGSQTDDYCHLVFRNGTFLTGPFQLPGGNSHITIDATATVRALNMTAWRSAGWLTEALITWEGIGQPFPDTLQLRYFPHIFAYRPFAR